MKKLQCMILFISLIFVLSSCNIDMKTSGGNWWMSIGTDGINIKTENGGGMNIGENGIDMKTGNGWWMNIGKDWINMQTENGGWISITSEK